MKQVNWRSRLAARARFVPLALLLSNHQARCQLGNGVTPRGALASNTTSSVQETAALIGVSAEIGELRATQEVQPSDSERQLTLLFVRQRVYERVTLTSLQVDATVAAIDNEISKATEVRGFLADKRDRDVTRANLLSALLGGGLSAASAALQLSSKQTTAGVTTGVAGGAISAALGLYGIRAQRGGTRVLDAEANMLAEFFSRPEMETSHYPPVIWSFLSEVAPSDPDHLTRRERLLRTWLELKRLDSLETSSGKTKVEHVTSLPDQRLPLTVDDLEDRIAMLQDVRAKISYLKRDLAALLASLPDSRNTK